MNRVSVLLCQCQQTEPTMQVSVLIAFLTVMGMACANPARLLVVKSDNAILKRVDRDQLGWNSWNNGNNDGGWSNGWNNGWGKGLDRGWGSDNNGRGYVKIDNNSERGWGGNDDDGKVVIVRGDNGWNNGWNGWNGKNGW